MGYSLFNFTITTTKDISNLLRLVLGRGDHDEDSHHHEKLHDEDQINNWKDLTIMI